MNRAGVLAVIDVVAERYGARRVCRMARCIILELYVNHPSDRRFHAMPFLPLMVQLFPRAERCHRGTGVDWIDVTYESREKVVLKNDGSVARRWRVIDAIRGFSIAGILFVNLPALLRNGAGPVSEWLNNVYDAAVTGRFYVIFSFLFGMSAALLYSSSVRRVGRRSARLLMVRRYVFLVPIALLHAFVLSPIDVLLPYAICAIVLLIPALFAPRWATLVAGIVITVIGDALIGVNYGAVPGLLLAGWGAAQFGLPKLLEMGDRRTIFVLVPAAIVGSVLTVWQLTIPGAPGATFPGYEYLATVAAFAGCFLATAYVCGFSLLWQGPMRSVLSAAFEPLGKMALTNYMSASFVFLLWGMLWPSSISGIRYPIVTIICIAVQSVVSRVWLRYFQYGPVEWVWRLCTRWQFTPMRRRVVMS